MRKHHKTGREQSTFQTWQGRVRASGVRVRGGAETRRGRDNLCATDSAAERRSRPPMSSRSRPAATRTRLTASSHALRSLASSSIEVRTELPDPLPFRAFSVSESLTTYLVRDFE